MKRVHYNFPGSFGKKNLPSDIYFADQSSQSPRLIIFFHGCCGTVYDHSPTTYQLVSEVLAGKEGISCAIFETSRNVQKIDVAPEKLDFQKFTQDAFAGKTFQDELTDARTAATAIIAEVTKTLGQTPELSFVGFSMGGLIATLLSQEFHPAKLYTFGSATCFAVEKDLPILGGGLSAAEIDSLKQVAAEFSGAVLLIHGSADDTALQPQARELLTWFTNAAESGYIELLGVDHRFKQRNNQNDSQLIHQIASYLS